MDNNNKTVEEDDNEVIIDSEDSLDTQKNSPLNRNKVKKGSNVMYKSNTLKAGKVRWYNYSMKHIGSLYLSTWVREDTEKDSDLYISSSNFKREYSKRKIKENQHYQT